MDDVVKQFDGPLAVTEFGPRAYVVVILRDDQIDLIAQRVVQLLRDGSDDALPPGVKVPVGDFFRMRWRTGKVGKWHLAGQPEWLGGETWFQSCPCGVSVPVRRVSVILDIQRIPPPTAESCKALRPPTALSTATQTPADEAPRT